MLLEKTLTRFPPDDNDRRILGELDISEELGAELRYWIENGSRELTGDRKTWLSASFELTIRTLSTTFRRFITRTIRAAIE
jgi:hypothetical protein